MPRLSICLLAFFLLGFSGSVWGLGIVSADGKPCTPQPSRDTEAKYHTGEDDYHLYGSHQWAVRFDFQDFYSAVPDCRFTIRKARIFFPNVASSATISLFADSDSLPTGNALRQVTTSINANLMDIPFPDTLSASVIWLVVDYNANGVTTFVSASHGGGSHSYYLNTNPTNPFLQSMNSAGFPCELAFGLLGTYDLDTPDLELISFGMEGTIQPRQVIRPTFAIYNHSALPATDTAIQLDITSPGSEYTVSDTIFITEIIPSQDSLLAVTPGYQDYRYDLPESPMQIKVKATLLSSLAEPETMQNNNIIVNYYQVFHHEYSFYQTEVFLRQNTTDALMATLDTVIPDSYRTLLYYPSLADSLANIDALDRFQWYGFNAYPSTAINGSQAIFGYLPDYQTRLQRAISTTLSERTFIGHTSKRINDLHDTEDLELELSFANDDTELYDSPSLNPMLQSRVFAGLFQKVHISGGSRFVLSKWIAFSDTVNSTFIPGTTIAKAYTFSCPNLSAADLVNGYCVYFWLQNTVSGQIVYADSLNFASSMFTAVNDEHTPPALLTLYPNPLRADSDLKLNGLAESARLRLFNLRGQVVWQTSTTTKSLSIPHQVFPTSGIYFMKVDYLSGLRPSAVKKISYIK